MLACKAVEKLSKLAGNSGWSSLHVRRGDFQYKQVKLKVSGATPLVFASPAPTLATQAEVLFNETRRDDILHEGERELGRRGSRGSHPSYLTPDQTSSLPLMKETKIGSRRSLPDTSSTFSTTFSARRTSQRLATPTTPACWIR